MIERAAGRLSVHSAMVTDNARAFFESGCALMVAGEQVFDLSAVDEADSSAVAVMLGWLRHAPTVGAQVRFAGIPSGVLSLAELYGTAELLPQA